MTGGDGLGLCQGPCWPEGPSAGGKAGREGKGRAVVLEEMVVVVVVVVVMVVVVAGGGAQRRREIRADGEAQSSDQ